MFTSYTFIRVFFYSISTLVLQVECLPQEGIKHNSLIHLVYSEICCLHAVRMLHNVCQSVIRRNNQDIHFINLLLTLTRTVM